MSERKPARPTRRFPSIAVAWKAGRWRFRACIRVDGKQRVGPCRDTQRAAFDDVDGLREKHRRNVDVWTVGGALQVLVDRARERGLEEYIVRGVWLRPGNALLRYWPERKALDSITADEVVRYIIWALDGDKERSQPAVGAGTLRRHYLRVMRAALVLAGLSEAPVAEALRETRARLRAAPRPVIGFEVEEVADVLRRLREFKPRNEVSDHALDLLLFELTATTGIRASELARLTGRDVDLERGALIVQAKSRAHPRVEPVVPALRDRLAARVAELPSLDDHLVPAHGPQRDGMPDWDPQASYLRRMVQLWKRRLREPRLSLRGLRRAHGTGLDTLGSRYAVIRSALGHSRTSDETPRYLTAASKEVIAAKERLAGHLLPQEDEDRGPGNDQDEPPEGTGAVAPLS